MDTSRQRRDDLVIAGGTGLAAAVVMGLSISAVGHVSGSEARLLVAAIVPTSRFLCSAVMTACATTLALMLTLLGLSINANARLEATFYHRIRHLAFCNMVVLVVATGVLVLHCIPISRSDSIDAAWYSTAYHGLLILSALLGGALITVVVLLYRAIRDLIHVVGLDDDSPIRRAKEEDQSREPGNAESA